MIVFDGVDTTAQEIALGWVVAFANPAVRKIVHVQGDSSDRLPFLNILVNLISWLCDFLASVVTWHSCICFFFSSQIFSGNSDRHSVVYHRFFRPFRAVYVKIHPRAWYSWISMRVELYGCTSEYFWFHVIPMLVQTSHRNDRLHLKNKRFRSVWSSIGTTVGKRSWIRVSEKSAK